MSVAGCSSAWPALRSIALGSAVLALAVMQVACISPKTAQETATSSPGRNLPLPTGSAAPKWLPLDQDGLHDPAGPAIRKLQEPAEALATLPPNKPRIGVGSYRAQGLTVNNDGNRVDWAQALSDEIIMPRRSRTPPGSGVAREELVMDMDMFLDLSGSMPIVRFPHLAHTRWLACSNCHPAIFLPEAGANRISMLDILNGKQCGICHRAVAFPPTDCARCHSLDRKSEEAVRVGAQAQERARAKAKAKAAAREQTKSKGVGP